MKKELEYNCYYLNLANILLFFDLCKKNFLILGIWCVISHNILKDFSQLFCYNLG